jgi:hypothetical protein
MKIFKALRHHDRFNKLKTPAKGLNVISIINMKIQTLAERLNNFDTCRH